MKDLFEGAITDVCKPSAHIFRPMHASTRERCELCQTIFPCRSCSHWDCKIERGEPLPDWVTVSEAS